MNQTRERDQAKSERTKALRGFDFAYAASVFADANRAEGEARTAKGEERRFVLARPRSVKFYLSFTPGDTMKTTKTAASSQRERLVVRSAADIRAFAKSPAAKAMSEEMRRRGPDPSEADLREIPELTDEELARLYRPVKAPVTVRLDGDVLAWLKSKGGKYQAHLNATLRNAMLAERRVGKGSAR
jgi:uncharacterized protein (DUF4415 family)